MFFAFLITFTLARPNNHLTENLVDNTMIVDELNRLQRTIISLEYELEKSEEIYLEKMKIREAKQEALIKASEDKQDPNYFKYHEENDIAEKNELQAMETVNDLKNKLQMIRIKLKNQVSKLPFEEASKMEEVTRKKALEEAADKVFDEAVEEAVQNDLNMTAFVATLEEAKRIAEEAEAKRIAEEAEANRKDEEEAKRKAEEEAKRIAEEAVYLATEKAERKDFLLYQNKKQFKAKKDFKKLIKRKLVMSTRKKISKYSAN